MKSYIGLYLFFTHDLCLMSVCLSVCVHRRCRWRTCRTTRTPLWESSTKTQTAGCLVKNSDYYYPSTN